MSNIIIWTVIGVLAGCSEANFHLYNNTTMGVFNFLCAIALIIAIII